MEIAKNRDDRLMAGFSHLSLLIPMFGVIIPLLVWFTQRERSALLRFQALQAAVYQFLGLAGYFIFVGCQVALPFMMIPLSLTAGFETNGEITEPSVGIIGILFFLIPMVGYGLLCIVGPIYLILGIAAFVKVVGGNDFRYPFLGNWIETKLSSPVNGEDRLDPGD